MERWVDVWDLGSRIAQRSECLTFNRTEYDTWEQYTRVRSWQTHQLPLFVSILCAFGVHFFRVQAFALWVFSRSEKAVFTRKSDVIYPKRQYKKICCVEGKSLSLAVSDPLFYQRTISQTALPFFLGNVICLLMSRVHFRCRIPVVVLSSTLPFSSLP